MRASVLFDAKNVEFFEIYGVSARTRGGGQFFAILCGRHLWKAPYFLMKIYKFGFKNHQYYYFYIKNV